MIEFAGIPFSEIRWQNMPEIKMPGRTGHATMQTFTRGGIRLRRVVYSLGYESDHWCDLGHVVHVLEGTLTMRLKDGRAIDVPAGGSFMVGDGIDPHSAVSVTGAKVFIVDASQNPPQEK
ncbi:MAG: DHCW motif cupin fold protein [Planctomycetes bacterium]|nr:DHCW motif cupin fold protein [Planctomycetota bacterium]